MIIRNNLNKMAGSLLINGPLTQNIISILLETLGENTGTGGYSIFLGQVRADMKEGKKVIEIEYSAYEAMVHKEADSIIQSILSEFDEVKNIKILHSVGRIKAGEISLFVLVSANHRRHAIDACSKTVELIKSNFPVWKKEIFEDNTHEWQENTLA